MSQLAITSDTVVEEVFARFARLESVYHPLPPVYSSVESSLARKAAISELFATGKRPHWMGLTKVKCTGGFIICARVRKEFYKL